MRVTFSVTILLTVATYKLFVSTTLPAVGYMTLCDQYVMACFMLQAPPSPRGRSSAGSTLTRGWRRVHVAAKVHNILCRFRLLCFGLGLLCRLSSCHQGLHQPEAKGQGGGQEPHNARRREPGWIRRGKAPSFLKASTSGDAVARRLSGRLPPSPASRRIAARTPTTSQ